MSEYVVPCEQLASESAELLPDRETMQLALNLNTNVAIQNAEAFSVFGDAEASNTARQSIDVDDQIAAALRL
jgi:hypothetical protein